MMKQYMKNKSLFLQKEELLSRIAELFSKKILRPSEQNLIVIEAFLEAAKR